MCVYLSTYVFVFSCFCQYFIFYAYVCHVFVFYKFKTIYLCHIQVCFNIFKAVTFNILNVGNNNVNAKIYTYSIHYKCRYRLQNEFTTIKIT